MENNIPKHIAMFPDGNSRWAKQNGLSMIDGYKKGYQNVLDFCEWCKNRGVKVLTVFGFSTENWKRNQIVVSVLMKIFETGLVENIEKYLKNDELQRLGVRVKIIGERDKLPKSFRKAVEKIEDLTKNNSNLFLNLAISYGGKWDILNAVKQIIEAKIPADKVDEKLFENYLSTTGLPPVDLVIRAGGEKRMSNFALWQTAYAELYFSPKFWPEFTESDLDEALTEFQKRTRNFGK